MNRLPMSKRVAVVSALVEGNSVRSTARITDVSKPTILKLLAELGTACAQFHNERVRNLTAQRIQCDEIWQFVGAKQMNVRTAEQAAKGWGDTWTWVAIDPETKLICTWFVGTRDVLSAEWFMGDLWDRMAVKTQLTTDGHYVYPLAVEKTFGQ